MSANRKADLPVSPVDLTDFGLRLREAMKGRHTQESLAAAIGISLSGLKNWLTASPSDPGWSSVILAARECGVSLDWLATGKGPKEAPAGATDSAGIDEDLMREVIEAIEENLAERAVTLAPGKKAMLINDLYITFSKEGWGDLGETAREDLVRRVTRLAG